MSVDAAKLWENWPLNYYFSYDSMETHWISIFSLTLQNSSNSRWKFPCHKSKFTPITEKKSFACSVSLKHLNNVVLCTCSVLSEGRVRIGCAQKKTRTRAGMRSFVLETKQPFTPLPLKPNSELLSFFPQNERGLWIRQSCTVFNIDQIFVLSLLITLCLFEVKCFVII